MRTYVGQNEQLFPNRCPLSNPNRTKNNMNTRSKSLDTRECTYELQSVISKLPRIIIEIFQIRRFNKLLIISFCLIFILVYFHKNECFASEILQRLYI